MYPSGCQLLVLGGNSKKTRARGSSANARLCSEGAPAARAHDALSSHFPGWLRPPGAGVVDARVALRRSRSPETSRRKNMLHAWHRATLAAMAFVSRRRPVAAQCLTRSFDDGVGSDFVRGRVSPVDDFRRDLLEKLSRERHHLVRRVSLRTKLPVNRLRQDGDGARVVSSCGDVDGQRHFFLEERQGAEPSGWPRRKQEECRQSLACGNGQLAVNRRAFDTAVRSLVRAPLRSSTPSSAVEMWVGSVM